MSLVGVWIVVSGLLAPGIVPTADAFQGELAATVVAGIKPPPQTLSAAQCAEIEEAADEKSFTLAPEPGQPITIAHDLTWAFDQTLTRDQMVSVLSTAMGPTDDFTATVGRVSRLEDPMPTLPDTNVIDVEIHNRHVLRGSDWRFENSAALTFVTSAAPVDAVAAYRGAFADLHWEIVERAEVQEGRRFMTIYGDPDVGGFGMGVDVEVHERVEGGSIVVFKTLEDHHPEAPPALTGQSWHEQSARPTFGEPSVFSASVTPAVDGDHEIELLSTFVDLPDESMLRELLASRLEVLQSFADGFHVDHQGDPAVILILPPHKDGDGVTLNMSQTVVVAADHDVPAATFLDGDMVGADVTLVEPNGPVIAVGMDAGQMAPVLAPMLGRTDDVGAVAARVGSFPAAVPTLPDASVISVRSSLRDPDLLGDAFPLNGYTEVDYMTSASVDQAEAAHTAALTDAGWILSTVSRNEYLDGRALITMQFDEFETRELGDRRRDISVQLSEGHTSGSTVSVTYHADGTRNELRGQLARLSSWYGDSLLPDGGEIQSVMLKVDFGSRGSTDFVMTVDVRYPGRSLDSITPAVLGCFAQHPDYDELASEYSNDLASSYAGFTDSTVVVELVEEVPTDRKPDGYVEVSVHMWGELP